jgi:hypothetical protein
MLHLEKLKKKCNIKIKKIATFSASVAAGPQAIAQDTTTWLHHNCRQHAMAAKIGIWLTFFFF